VSTFFNKITFCFALKHFENKYFYFGNKAVKLVSKLLVRKKWRQKADEQFEILVKKVRERKKNVLQRVTNN
jgi:hypothetical protein